MSQKADLKERDERFTRIRTEMCKYGMIALLIAGHASHNNRGYIRYVADTHLWSGDSLILLPLENPPVQVQVTYASASRPDQIWISDYREAPSPHTEIIAALKEKGLTKGKVGVAGMDHVLTIEAYESLKVSLPNIKFINADLMMNKIRSIKSALEIDQNRELWDVSMLAMETFVEIIQPGVSQREAASEVGKVIKAAGSLDDLILIRDGKFKGLPRNEPLNCDNIVELHLETCGESGHWSELNVSCLFREPVEVEQRLLEHELAIFEELRKLAKPGIKLSSLTDTFHHLIEQSGWILGSPAWHYYFHGQGMDAIEWPYYSPMPEGNQDAILEPGMVFSYHPHRVPSPAPELTPRIFDDIIITKSGAERMNNQWDLRWRIKD